MSAKRPNEMKNAFQALRVNQPLRLSKDGPGLSAPKSDSTKEAPQSEAPLSGVTGSSNPSGEAPRIEVPRTKASAAAPLASGKPTLAHAEYESPQSEAPLSEAARVEDPLSGVPRHEHAQNEVAKNELAQIGRPRSERPRSEHPRSELAQGEPPAEAQIEVPHFEDVESNRSSTTTSGFFKLSHSLFTHPTIRDMSGDCFRLFLWMSSRAWRYPDSTGVIRASVRFIEDEIGMGHATISRALKTLKEHQMVQVLEVDYKRGNTWRVSNLALSGSTPDPKPGRKRARDEVPHSEQPRRESVAASKEGDRSLKLRAEAPQIEDHYKKYKNLNKYSQEALRPLLDRVAAFDALRKREAELSNLNSILETFDLQKVQLALDYVDSKGTLRGEKCHSPFSYLSLAIDDVLQRIAPKPTTNPISVTMSAPPQSEMELEVTRVAICSFEAELSTEAQKAFVDHFRSTEYQHGFLPPSLVLKKLAAAAWFTERRSDSDGVKYQSVG